MDTIQTEANSEATNTATPLPREQFGPGDCIDERYQIVSVLGRGGCGCVYKVIQIALKKQFALKTLNPLSTSEVTTLRLHKEAQAASRLQHPNLVRAVDFGMIGGTQPYLVMDLVEGPTLSQYLKQHGKTSVQEALQLFLPLCSALAYAHEQGVVHRDLKPSNVILAGDSSGSMQFVPKIVDFGIAKLKSSDATHAMTLTATGDIFGTPLYMSPEQCMGTGVDGRSDIYALGCMLFETITGAPPFAGTNALEIMMQHNTAKMPSLKEASLGESFPPALEKVIGRMLEKNPKDRYQDCVAVAKDLEAIARGDFKGISVSPESVALREKRQLQLSTSLVSAAIGIIFGALLTFAAQQYMNPTSTLVGEAKTTESTGTGVFDLETGFSYYSTIAGPDKIFKFPSSQKHSLGKIYWWEAGKLRSVDAIGRQTVPRDAKLIFSVDGVILVAPNIWPCFRPREFDGIVFAPHTCYVEPDPLNQSFRAVSEQDDLRILTMSEKFMTAKSFYSFGSLSHLRWLSLRNIMIDNVDGPLNGLKVAKLQNLQQLQVLQLENIADIAPAIKALSGATGLRRLSLIGCKLSTDDIEHLAELPSLEVLNLHNDTIPDADFWRRVSKMHNLRQLIVEANLMEKLNLEALSKLHLTLVTQGAKLPPSLKTAIESNHAIKLIDDADAVKTGGALFDPLQSDPEPVLSPGQAASR